MSEFNVATYVDPPKPSEDAFRLRTEALPALSHPRPLEMFEESCRAMGLGGNLGLASTIYLAATTRVLSARKRLHAHTYVLGPASSGKSFETDAALEHLPPVTVERFEGCSPRALIYGDRDIHHKVILYAELDSLPLGNGDDDSANAALTYLRTLVVNGVASYEVTVKTKEGYGTRRYVKEGPATLIVTGTRRLPDEQLASRLHEVEVLVDRARLRSVVGAQGRLLQGSKTCGPAESIVAAQAYLQELAPLDVSIPFAEALGRAILERAKLTDPRLTREFPRIAGFTAAHALLCLERRERDSAGALVATLEDYEAASGVIKELSTTREFSQFAIDTWLAVDEIYKTTSKPVTVALVAKKLLKAHDHVRRTLNLLLAGGALLDARERPSRTAPHLVVPASESPVRILLPTVEELVEHGCPALSKRSKRQQVVTSEPDSFDIEAGHFDIEVSSMTSQDLSPLRHSDLGVNAQAPVPAAPAAPPPDPAVFRHSDGKVYRAGDVLPDGRRVLEVDGGLPVLGKARTVDGIEVRL